MNAKQANGNSALIGFTAVAAPFLAYSIYRAGYSLRQLIELRALSVASILLILISVAALIVAQRRLQPVRATFAGAFVAAAFAACHTALAYPLDYKLWIYVVAPRFVFATLAAVISMALFRRDFPNARNA